MTYTDNTLIDVWKVSNGYTSYYDENEDSARREAENCDDVTVTKVKMRRDVYESLPEFDGF